MPIHSIGLNISTFKQLLSFYLWMKCVALYLPELSVGCFSCNTVQEVTVRINVWDWDSLIQFCHCIIIVPPETVTFLKLLVTFARFLQFKTKLLSSIWGIFSCRCRECRCLFSVPLSYSEHDHIRLEWRIQEIFKSLLSRVKRAIFSFVPQ